MGHWKNRWIQTPQRILMDPYIKQAPVLSKRFWIIPWPLAYNTLELHCVRKIINFWYTFGWKWRVFVTIWDCRTHVRMTSMTSSVEWTNLDFKISVALLVTDIFSENHGNYLRSLFKFLSLKMQHIWCIRNLNLKSPKLGVGHKMTYKCKYFKAFKMKTLHTCRTLSRYHSQFTGGIWCLAVRAGCLLFTPNI